MLNDQALDHVRETFTGGTVPKNVTAGRNVGKIRILRRLTSFALGSSLFSAAGSFNYRIGQEVKRINFNGRNLQFRAIYDSNYKHGYEIETALLVAILCSDDRRGFWDIGANWGYFSLLTASLPDFGGRIEAFEPNPRTFQDLRSMVGQAGLGERIQCHNLGAGSTCCEMTVAESDRFNSGLSQLASGGGGDKVPVTTLDEFKGAEPGFIKIDAEGMEFDILKGAVRVMRTARPHLLFENFADHQNPADTCLPMQFLQAEGYKVHLPVLRFKIRQNIVSVTYGSYCNPLFEQDARPRLELMEFKNADRFLLCNQLNLLAVHTTREPELKERGLI